MSMEEPKTVNESMPILANDVSPVISGGEPLGNVVSIESLITTLKPTGCIITMQIPQVGTQGPVVAIRVGPCFPTSRFNDINGPLNSNPSALREGLPDHRENYVQMNETRSWEHPVMFPTPGNSPTLDGIYPYRGASFLQSGSEPLLSRWAKLFRYYEGDMIYSIRAISNRTVQAYFRAGIVNGSYCKKFWSDVHASSVFPTFDPILEYDQTIAANNGWLRVDCTDKRHVAMRVPFRRNLPFVDRMWEGPYTSNYLVPNAHQYLVLQLEGVTASPGTSTIQFALEYAAGPNMKFSCPLGPFVNEYPCNQYFGEDKGYPYIPFWYYHHQSYYGGDPKTLPVTWPFYRRDFKSDQPATSTIFQSIESLADQYKTPDEKDADLAAGSYLMRKIPAARELRKSLQSLDIKDATY